MISVSIPSWTLCISQCRSLACPIFACTRTADSSTCHFNPKYLEFLLEKYMLIKYAWIKQPSKALSHPISTFQFPTKILFHYPISHPIFLSNQVINSKIDNSIVLVLEYPDIWEHVVGTYSSTKCSCPYLRPHSLDACLVIHCLCLTNICDRWHHQSQGFPMDNGVCLYKRNFTSNIFCPTWHNSLFGQ